MSVLTSLTGIVLGIAGCFLLLPWIAEAFEAYWSWVARWVKAWRRS